MSSGALLLTTGAGAIFCNGLNLGKVMTLPPEEVQLITRVIADALLADPASNQGVSAL